MKMMIPGELMIQKAFTSFKFFPLLAWNARNLYNMQLFWTGLGSRDVQKIKKLGACRKVHTPNNNKIVMLFVLKLDINFIDTLLRTVVSGLCLH